MGRNLCHTIVCTKSENMPFIYQKLLTYSLKFVYTGFEQQWKNGIKDSLPFLHFLYCTVLLKFLETFTSSCDRVTFAELRNTLVKLLLLLSQEE